MGTALTEIFSYLELGDNSESTVLSMTTPFFISDTTNAAGTAAATTAAIEEEETETTRMFVKLPTDSEVHPPHPVPSSSIILDDFPETVMATLSFAGIITEGEMTRQKVKLLDRIETTKDLEWNIKIKKSDKTTKKINIDVDDVDVDEEKKKMKMKNDDDNDGDDKEGQHEFLFLQYNAPGTLPWRRMNEIAIVMEKKKSTVTTSSKRNDDDDNNIKDYMIKNDQGDDDSAVSASHSVSVSDTEKEEEEKVEDDESRDNDNNDSHTSPTD